MTSTIYFLVLVLIYASVPLGKTFPFEYGVVTPSDPFKFVGENLTLDCNITNENVKENSSMLGFQRATLNGGQYTIPKENIRILTSKAIRLFIPHLKLEDDGNYICFQNTFKNRVRVIGNQRVLIDNRPKRIESIDCSVYNWENMTCRWSLGVHFQHPEHVNVLMKWVTDNAQELCPKLTKTSCEWPAENYQQTSIYLMVLIVQTMQHDKVVYEAPRQQFKVETEHYTTDSTFHIKEPKPVKIIAILQPAPIRDFQAEEENSTCIRLNWKHSTTRTSDKTFQGKYLKSGSKDWKKINMSLMTTKKSVNLEAPTKEETLFNFMSVPVCDLIPFTNYTFSVSVLPYSRDSDAMKSHGRRSDWISVPATTREDVPGIPPPQCHSCFFIHSCPHPKDGQRCARIYWGETPVSQRHGKLTYYSIRFETEKGNGVTNRSDPVPKITVSHDVTNADFTISDAAYKVNLTSSTVKGPSPVPTVLAIPSKKENMPSPPEHFLVEKYTNQTSPVTYNLAWHRSSTHLKADANITIVWCIAGVEYYVCKNYIQWITLPSYTPSYSMVRHGRINIGIAMEALIDGRLVSSGIEWTPCIYNKNQRPKPPGNIRFSKNPPKGGLTVQWRRSDCREKAFVTGYKVSICITIDGTTCFGKANATEDIKRTEHTFLKLNATEHYLVQVWANSQAGYGLPSLPINATVLPFNSNGHSDSGSALSQALIIIIIIIIVIVISIIFVSCIKCLKDRHNKANVTFSTLNPHPESTNHGSSGRGSGSLSDNSANTNLLNDTTNTGNFDDREYHYPVLKQDRDSSSSSGNFTDLGNSSKSVSSNTSFGKFDNVDDAIVYSKEQNIVRDNYSRVCLTSGSDETIKKCNPDNHLPTVVNSSSVVFHPHKDKITINIPSKAGEPHGPAYETPVKSPDSAIDVEPQSPWVFNQQNTLLIRRPSPQGYAPLSISKGDSNFIIGRINAKPIDTISVQSQKQNQQKRSQPEFQNGFNSSSNSPTPPSSTLPTVPPRQPLLDNPPLYNAPLPPNFVNSIHSSDIGNPSKVLAKDPSIHQEKQNSSPTVYLKHDTNPLDSSEIVCEQIFPLHQGIPDNYNTPFIFCEEEIRNLLQARPFCIPPPPPFPPTHEPVPHQITIGDSESHPNGSPSPKDTQQSLEIPNNIPANKFNINNNIIPFEIDPDSFLQ